MTFIAPIDSTTVDGITDGTITVIIGIIVIVLNITKIFILHRKGDKRGIPENIILSLAASDSLVEAVYIAYGISKLMLYHNPNSSIIFNVGREIRLCLSFTTIVSVFHLLVITAERFYALHRPLKYRAVVTKKRMLIVIIFIWICSLIIVPLIALLRRVIQFPKGLIGVFQGWLIFITVAVMILVYGYLSYYLFNRFQLLVSKKIS